MNDNQTIEALLEQGIKAAEANDHATARPLLERVIERDQHNEKAWYWLAAVVDDIEEKRICLHNVLVLNPQNTRAKALLDQLEKSSPETDTLRPETPAASQGSPPRGSNGGKRRLLLLVAVVLFLIIGAGAALLLLNDDDNSSDAEPALTTTSAGVAANQPISEGTPAPENLPTATDIPAITPTSPPPTWTPIPSSTPIQKVLPTLLPSPPSDLPGTVILESGNVPGDRENHPIVLMAANGSGQRLLTGNMRGHTPVLAPDSNQYAYIEFLSGTREELLTLNNIQNTNPRPASTYWQDQDIGRLFEQDTPDWSPAGNQIVFTAVGMGSLLPDLYLFSLIENEERGTSLQRLTQDDVIESWPSFSPDGSLIVYVADKSRMEFSTPIDLNLYNIEAGTITPLTTDGADIIEAAPDWAPDGRSIIFQGRKAEASTWDIYRISLYGDGEPVPIIASDFDDIRPRYSPDGRYILFSSDRSGNWDVFIYSIAQEEIYQLTTSPEVDIANDWSR